jgi:hypothetical protein
VSVATAGAQTETLWRKTFFFASLYTLSAAPALVVTYRFFPSFVFRAEGLALTHNPVSGWPETSHGPWPSCVF